MGEELQVGGRPEDNLEGRKKEGNRDRPSEPEGRGGEGRGGEGRDDGMAPSGVLLKELEPP